MKGIDAAVSPAGFEEESRISRCSTCNLSLVFNFNIDFVILLVLIINLV
jgi:hypothetical protein